jgi:hypothetical protein
MKKIFLSAVLAASSWVVFAQDNTSNQTNNANSSNTTSDQQMNSSTSPQTNTTTNQNSLNQNNTNLNNNSQNPTSNQTYNSASTSNYNAYGVPNYVQMNFQAQHPNASNLTWTTSTADWYHGYYSDANGRYTHVYYSTDPYYNVKYYPERITGYTVALPVLQTWVPDAVITTAGNLYKQNLYDIAAMKGNNNTEMYVVRVLDNGELKSMYMDANGTAVTNYIRTEEQMNTTGVNSSMSTDANAAMDNNSSNNNTGNSSMNTDNSSMNNTDANAKTKTKTKMSDGSEIKTKTKDGKTKTKISGSSTNDNTNQQF